MKQFRTNDILNIHNGKEVEGFKVIRQSNDVYTIDDGRQIKVSFAIYEYQGKFYGNLIRYGEDDTSAEFCEVPELAQNEDGSFSRIKEEN